jgi:WD40 repeat protein
VKSAFFSPDGNTLITNSSDLTVRMWDTRAFRDPAALTDQACALAGGFLTEQEWHGYVPDGVAYRRTCP